MRILLVILALAGVTAPQAAIWGGDHIEIELTESGARVEFDCAHGTLDSPLRPDDKGAFELKGTFTPERSGPTRGDGPPPLKATYSGAISKDTMTLRLVVEGQDPKGTTYELTRGQRGNIRKCR